MVTCIDFYDKFARIGNFCKKSEYTAKEIHDYIDYIKRYNLTSYEVNRCALKPFVQIQEHNYLHTRCLKELKRRCKSIGGRHVTRRITVEIINKVNESIPIQYRIKEIKDVRRKMDGFQHEINDVSWEVREAFDKMKEQTGIRGNNSIMLAMIKYCTGDDARIEEIKELIEVSRQKEEKEKERLNGDSNENVPEIIVRRK